MNNWKFNELSNVAVITTCDIVNGASWVGYVTHDTEDGVWQFSEYNKVELSEQEASMISLREMLEIDASIEALADLPLGWCAWRKTKESDWLRKKII